MSSANLTKLKRKATELEQKKEFDKALALYIQIIDEAGRDLDDADLQLFNRVGDLLTRQNDVSEALAYYEKAVDVYAERGYLNNAIALCNKVLRQSPGRSTVYYKLGKISARKGFKSDARKNFLEYADRMQKGGQVDEAFRALKEFADLCPDQDDIRLMLADLLTKEQRSGEAIEQLERLYARLETEGRTAEARATMERIKAIDPDITPRPSGAFVTQRTNELVFLDLDDAGPPPGRAATPDNVTPHTAPTVVDVSGVGALQGLAITFLPDESPLPDVDEGARAVTALDGLEPTEAPPLPPEANLEVVEVSDLVKPVDPRTLDPDSGLAVDHPEWKTPDDVVTPVDGLATVAVTLAGVSPTLAPLLDEPPLSTEEFRALELDAVDEQGLEREHDLALSSSLPLMTGDGVDEPPASGVHELGTEDVEQSIVASGMLDAAPDEWATAALAGELAPAAPSSGPDDEAPEAPGAPADPPTRHDVAGADELPADVPEPTRIGDGFDADSLRPTPTPESIRDLDADAREPAMERGAEPPPSLAGHEVDDDAPEPGNPRSSSGTPPRAPELPPEFALEDFLDHDLHSGGSVLDTSALRADLRKDRVTAEPTPPEAVPEGPSPDPQRQVAHDSDELPLIDLGQANFGAPEPDGTEDTPGDLDSLLSTPPSFGQPIEPAGFVPGPVALPPNSTTDEWASPEVLIDGEWRDEHMGDLVSGETHSVGGGHAGAPPGGHAPFDDLAAAMLDGGEGPEKKGPADNRTPGVPAAKAGGSYTPRSTLSFGGLEAQLRRRLELDPTDAVLRRQLGEAMLELGQREEGLYELEVAAADFESRGDLGGARDTVDVILRTSPDSVQHHQKRVELSARSGDRSRLAAAYTDLADALFRSGDPEKARAVYSRVLELSPGSERARFALSVLSDGPGSPRNTDDLPVLREQAPAAPLPAGGAVPGGPRGANTAFDAALDAEVEAAFADDPPRPRGDLPAREGAPGPAKSPPVSKPAGNGFVDLGALLQDARPERSTRMVSTDVAPTGDEKADFAEMLRRFKQGVAENVEEEDFASHYDLGVAFKEMGLMDEAIAQFQRSLRGPEHRVRSYEALGQCFVEKGQHQVAVALLQRVADARGVDDQELVGVLYLLGFACEAVGRQQDATGYYQRVFAVDIDFRDVRHRLAALDRTAK